MILRLNINIFIFNSLMNNQPISKEIMIDICKYGIYYYPATKHYENGGQVSCDRCFKNYIDMSIGWKNYDLCLPCVNEINEQLKNRFNTKIMTNMMQNQFDLNSSDDNKIKTKMLQNQFNSTEIKTKMQQNQFNSKNENMFMTFMHQDQFNK
jgi:hypothetical protein